MVSPNALRVPFLPPAAFPTFVRQAFLGGRVGGGQVAAAASGAKTITVLCM